MIVRNFHIVGVTIHPPEANAVLVIDPYRMLPASISLQGMQIEPGPRTKIP
jgi:hypothetical protein